jgi:hypothetical protein
MTWILHSHERSQVQMNYDSVSNMVRTSTIVPKCPSKHTSSHKVQRGAVYEVQISFLNGPVRLEEDSHSPL